MGQLIKCFTVNADRKLLFLMSENVGGSNE